MQESSAPTLPDTFPIGDIANVGISLAVIVVAIIAIGWIYSRMQGMRGPRGQVMQVLATQPLGPKERVLLVRIAGKQLVLGVTATQMQTLLVLDGNDTPAPEPAPTTGFAVRLKRALAGGAR